jgi:signal transduction histidine kinase
MADFADLVATAIANAATRDELIASRARIVTAGDEARRRLERNLHDGAQQRLVPLGLALRVAEGTVPPGEADLKAQLSRITAGLIDVSEDLREIARGIHPAILSKGGLVLRRRPVPPLGATPSGVGRAYVGCRGWPAARHGRPRWQSLSPLDRRSR